MERDDAKLYVGVGAAGTIFILMVLNAIHNPTSALPDESLYILLLILGSTLGIDLFRNTSQ